MRLLNQRLAETGGINDALRRFKGKEAAGTPLRITELGEAVDYEQELLNALPYGIAATLFSEDDLTGMANVYRSDYAGMIADCVRAFPDEEE